MLNLTFLLKYQLRFYVVLSLVTFLSATSSGAATYYISEQGSDIYNTGSEGRPFSTIQKGLSGAKDGDTIYIKSGTYDLKGLSETINNRLTIRGEDKDSTILKNCGSFTFTKDLRVENLKFIDSKNTIFQPYVESGNRIEGVVFQNCIFENVYSAIRQKTSTGTITDFLVNGCTFKNIGYEGLVFGVALNSGTISDVRIENNFFENIFSTGNDKGATAIWVGSNITLINNSSKNIYILNNYINKITGTVVNTEVHGIVAYGDNINIIGNTVKELNYAANHEAIYIKGMNSKIMNNIVVNGGAKEDGDITVKGAERAIDNIVAGNYITGNQSGFGLVVYGSIIIEGNYINKPKGKGCGTCALGKSYSMTKNVFITKDRTLSLSSHPHGESGYDPPEANIFKNHLVSFESYTIVNNSKSGVNIYDNIECKGYDCDLPQREISDMQIKSTATETDAAPTIPSSPINLKIQQ